VTTTQGHDRFTALPDEEMLADTVVALEGHGFSVEVVDDLDAAREAVLARIPEGTAVMTNTSVTLDETGIADAINDGGPYESMRNKLMALDFATQLQEMKAIGGEPDYSLGSVHAITRDGAIFIASATGSQLASEVWGAANVIFVVGVQKLVPTAEAARERIFEHSLPLEDARAIAAYGQNSSVGKILEIDQEPPGRTHIVLIRQSVGVLMTHHAIPETASRSAASVTHSRSHNLSLAICEHGREGSDMSYSHHHAPTHHARIVLARRKSAGIQVTLLWAKDTNAVAVLIHDDGTDDHFEVPVAAGANALHVFEHPYAYAAWQGVDYRTAA
jgi:hypothetical protein